MANARKTREQILAYNDIKTEEIEVPEWETTLKIQGFTLAQRNSIFERSTDPVTGKINSLRAEILTFIAGVVDPPFTDNDMTALRGKSCVVSAIVLRIFALSGIGKDALETAIKNSLPTPSEDLSTS